MERGDIMKIDREYIKAKINGHIIEMRLGNTKLPKDTLIFNMGTAKECPSKLLGLCKIPDKCYALKPETNFCAKHVVPYRERQALAWTKAQSFDFINFFIELFRNKKIRKQVKYFRFNESGDFYCQKCVGKLSTIAQFLKQQYGIITYGYTSRSDLRFDHVRFLVKGSGHNKGNNGMCKVIGKKEETPKGFVRCPGSCKTCKLCKVPSKINIAFPIH